MSEENQKKLENKETQGTDANTEKGDKSEAVNEVDRAIAAAERLEKANEEAAKLNKETADLIARDKLGGKSLSDPEPQKKAEQSPGDYAKEVMANINPDA